MAAARLQLTPLEVKNMITAACIEFAPTNPNGKVVGKAGKDIPSYVTAIMEKLMYA